MAKYEGVKSEKWWRFKREHGYPIMGKAYDPKEWGAIRVYENTQEYLARYRQASHRQKLVQELDIRIGQFVDDGLGQAVKYRSEAFLKASQNRRLQARQLERKALKIEADIIELLECDGVDYLALGL